MNRITSEQVNAAQGVLRADYYQDVRDIAESVIEEWNAGNIDGRDELIEYIDQTVDGCQRVIYTGQAMDALRYSDNDDAVIESLGVEGFDWSSGVPWSQLAYFAVEQDVFEMLDSIGLDPNDPAEPGTIEAQS